MQRFDPRFLRIWELEDAHGSGLCGRKGVEVQVLTRFGPNGAGLCE
jgi:hypothetical protein